MTDWTNGKWVVEAGMPHLKRNGRMLRIVQTQWSETAMVELEQLSDTGWHGLHFIECKPEQVEVEAAIDTLKSYAIFLFGHGVL